MIRLDHHGLPFLLKQIADPPKELYVIGNEQVLNKMAVAVVGTRLNTFYGEKVTRQIVAPLARAGLVIVSGLAHGIDSIAHETTIENDGITVGVTGYGFNQIPYSKKSLINKICQKGCVISEYPPDAPAHNFTFVQRNRLISGLALGTLVTEAPKGSGALITADFSLDQNRWVWAVPGPIDQPTCQGTNEKIKEGAALVTQANDIFKALDLADVTESSIAIKDLSDGESRIFEKLRAQPLTIDQIVYQTGLHAHETLTNISLLEIKGLIQKDLDGRYHLT